jgi:superfamily II DNA or RNA helicase
VTTDDIADQPPVTCSPTVGEHALAAGDGDATMVVLPSSSSTGADAAPPSGSGGNTTTNLKITTFTESYAALTAAITNPSKRGKEFERYLKWWLKNDPRFDFTEVWLWEEDWPGKWKEDEAGIDLVAQCANGDLWAIQSKDYITNVTKDEVDKFVAESGRKRPDGKSHLFARRVFITTADSVSFHADDLVKGSLPELVIWCRGHLEKAPVSWPASPEELHTPIPQPEPKIPLKYQELALEAIAKGFTEHDRGQLVMACGTGKTVTAVWAGEGRKAQFIAVFAPNLGLLDQTFTDWKLNRKVPFESLIVASDKSVGRDDAVSSTSQLIQPATTDAEDIKAFVLRNSLLPKVIFSTYQSSPVVGEALNQSGMTLDLAIIDEAHRTAGQIGSEFTTVLGDVKMPAAKRLFMTATPKMYTSRVQAGVAERNIEVASMDNEKIYGPVFYYLSFYDAIYTYKRLSEYQARTIIVKDDNPVYSKYLTWAIDRYILKNKDDEEMDIHAGLLATAVALIKGIKELGLRRVIVYHTRVATARVFAQMLRELIAFMDEKDRPGVKVDAKHVSGAMPTKKRTAALRWLRNTDGTTECRILCNARVLTEGIDVPALDGLVFADPKRSVIDIQQAVGRVLRWAEGKDKGHVIVPVFLKADDDPEEALAGSAYQPVWNVLLALKEHDTRLAEWIDNYRFMLGKVGKSHIGPVKLPPQLSDDFGLLVNADFYQAFALKLIEATGVSTEGFLGAMEAYVAEFGDALVPQRYERAADGLKLGVHLNNARRRRGLFTAEQQKFLKKLPKWTWNAREAQRVAEQQEFLQHIYEYAKKHDNDTAHIPAKHVCDDDDYPLGRRVNYIRTNRDNSTAIPDDFKKEIEKIPGWSWSPQDDDWKAGLDRYVQYRQENDGEPPSNSMEGRWVKQQRRDKRDGKKSMTPEREKLLLDAVPDWTWDTTEQRQAENDTDFAKFVCELHKYYDQFGDLLIKARYVTPEKYALGRQVNIVRSIRAGTRKGILTPGQIHQLEEEFGDHWKWRLRERSPRKTA